MEPQFTLPFNKPEKKVEPKKKEISFEQVFGRINYDPKEFGGQDLKMMFQDFLDMNPDGNEPSMSLFILKHQDLMELPKTVRERITKTLFKMLEVWLGRFDKATQASYEAYLAAQSSPKPKPDKPQLKPEKPKGGMDHSLPRGDRDEDD